MANDRKNVTKFSENPIDYGIIEKCIYAAGKQFKYPLNFVEVKNCTQVSIVYTKVHIQNSAFSRFLDIFIKLRDH